MPRPPPSLIVGWCHCVLVTEALLSCVCYIDWWLSLLALLAVLGNQLGVWLASTGSITLCCQLLIWISWCLSLVIEEPIVLWVVLFICISRNFYAFCSLTGATPAFNLYTLILLLVIINPIFTWPFIWSLIKRIWYQFLWLRVWIYLLVLPIEILIKLLKVKVIFDWTCCIPILELNLANVKYFVVKGFLDAAWSRVVLLVEC